jgi:hypothetical protein
VLCSCYVPWCKRCAICIMYVHVCARLKKLNSKWALYPAMKLCVWLWLLEVRCVNVSKQSTWCHQP